MHEGGYKQWAWLQMWRSTSHCYLHFVVHFFFALHLLLSKSLTNQKASWEDLPSKDKVHHKVQITIHSMILFFFKGGKKFLCNIFIKLLQKI